ncbi:MAG: DNA alkylation repair protein [Mesorhizobium sp.]
MTDTAAASPELKHIFNRERLEHFARETSAVFPAFADAAFLDHASRNLDDLGIMQRMRQVAQAYDATLPASYEQALDILGALAPRIGHGFASISLCEFVTIRGTDHFDRSMAALAHFTRFGSAEFAIRPFIQRDAGRALAIMRGWAEDENEHVRRLASEGTRPRLPWSFQLRELAADPSKAMPILERLKADPAIYVRKSVANHLNDISKEHPDWLVAQLGGWDQSAAETKWIVGQAVRTLVKKGDTRALALVGASGEAEAQVTRFSVSPESLRLGDRLSISATVISTGNERQRIVADYAIHYVKASGRPSRKVFKLKAFDLAPGEAVDLSISQTIKDFSTRKHHPGHHEVELMLNGAIVARGGFDLT